MEVPKPSKKHLKRKASSPVQEESPKKVKDYKSKAVAKRKLAWEKLELSGVQEDWWTSGLIYHIYPRSFKDSNNDGIGDLRGIISKLDHLKDIGVTAAWLSPIFPSPQVDGGYDVSDYVNIDPCYGTLDDFNDLVAQADSLNIKIILDFVLNHTSNQHVWFKESEERSPQYENYYVWRDASPDGGPPNNWLSVFHGSAWEWSPKREQYYLHQFAPEQPDLNYSNPNVLREMKSVLTFWMDKGVSGFRLDAVPHICEDECFQDEPLSDKPDVQPHEYDYLDHIYTKDQPETFSIIAEIREHINRYTAANYRDTILVITEAYSSMDNIIQYYERGAHFSFNFELITNLDKNSSAQNFVDNIEEWRSAMLDQYVNNWVLGNHDNPRVGTRFGEDKIDGLNMLLAILPGVAITYYGEEIGMVDAEIDVSQSKDPLASTSQPTRDGARTPFQWDSSDNAGFNDGAETWLPIHPKYTENNLEDQKTSILNTHYHVYKTAMMLRQDPVLRRGTTTVAASSKGVLIVCRALDKSHKYFLLFNLRGLVETVNLNEIFPNAKVGLIVEVASSNSLRSEGHIMMSQSIQLDPYEAVIVREN